MGSLLEIKMASMVAIRKTLADILRLSTVSMIVTAVVTFVALTFYITAPFGRHTRKGFGFHVKAELAWFLMEIPNIFITATVYTTTIVIDDLATNNSITDEFSDNLSENSRFNYHLPTPNKILMLLFVLHYLNRSIIYPFRMGYYSQRNTPMPITVMLCAFAFCTWNGFNQSVSLLIINMHREDYIYAPSFIIGVLMFFVGLVINIRSDNILFGLRKEQDVKVSIINIALQDFARFKIS